MKRDKEYIISYLKHLKSIGGKNKKGMYFEDVEDEEYVYNIVLAREAGFIEGTTVMAGREIVRITNIELTHKGYEAAELFSDEVMGRLKEKYDFDEVPFFILEELARKEWEHETN